MKGSAHVAADARGHTYPPEWNIERSVAPRTPGFAQWWAEPARTAAISIPGDSTGYSTRMPWYLTQLLAARNPLVKVVYHLADYNYTPAESDGPPYPPTHPWFADFSAGNTGAFSKVYNAATWAAGDPTKGIDPGEDTYMPLPGTQGYYMEIPASGRWSPWGTNITKGMVGLDVAPTTWLPSGNMSLISQTGAAGFRGTVLRVGTDGRLSLITSPNGTDTITAFSTATVRSTMTTDGTRRSVCCVFNVDNSGVRTYTFKWRATPEDPWQQLGDVVNNTVSDAIPAGWFGHKDIAWRIGDGAVLSGKIYGSYVKLVDEKGPDLIPRDPQMWHPTTPNMKNTLGGGRVLHVVNAAWPQHGLDDFLRRTDLGQPGPVYTKIFTRSWNSSPVTSTSGNGYSYMESAMPLRPYLLTIVNHGHNGLETGVNEIDNWRRMSDAVEARSPDAQHCLLVQNPTLRTDGDPGNVLAGKRDHDWRISQSAALAQKLGMTVLDARSPMVDYVRNGTGPLSDLLQVGGQSLHPNTVGGLLDAKSVLSQMVANDWNTQGLIA